METRMKHLKSNNGGSAIGLSALGPERLCEYVGLTSIGRHGYCVFRLHAGLDCWYSSFHHTCRRRLET
jgi:hypothetical protein